MCCTATTGPLASPACTHCSDCTYAPTRKIRAINQVFLFFRWRLVIHGGIDGYSRLVAFLSCSNNNRAATVLEHFVKATALYGLPSNVRVDAGVENKDVLLFMNIFGHAITGRSVHNQRIERLWVDTWMGVVNTYHSLFSEMEATGILDCCNDKHIWALHYVFIPRINASLQSFRHQWNCHGLRTESHMTPMQIYVSSALKNKNSSLTSVQEIFRQTASQAPVVPQTASQPAPVVPQELGEEITHEIESQGVEIPPTPSCLSDYQYSLLRQQIDPLRGQTVDNGIDMYNATLDAMNSLLRQNE